MQFFLKGGSGVGLKLKLIVYPLSLIKQSGVFIVYFVGGTGGKAPEKTLCDLCVTTGPGTRTIGISPSLESTSPPQQRSALYSDMSGILRVIEPSPS